MTSPSWEGKFCEGILQECDLSDIEDVDRRENYFLVLNLAPHKKVASLGINFYPHFNKGDVFGH